MKMQMKNIIALPLLLSVIFLSCAQSSTSEKEQKTELATKHNKPTSDLEVTTPSNLKKAYFASGCFWCVEAIYESINGVKEAISGYSGGTTINPTYEEVSRGNTGHAETVEVIYDPKKVSFKTLVKAFFDSHDPTTLNRQGPDSGTQYRSIAFYNTNEEKKIIEDYVAELKHNKTFKKPIVTEIKKFDVFWEAEGYHQNFEEENPLNPYIQSVSKPRLEKFKKEFNKSKE
ncbi:hypothetical protein Y10_31910 [Neptunitalea sp. Y10]|uniref:Peptide methionine sulfoxide reductase MsrA n=2 Tax=Neptunitalea lumnitzerae TaxID=2965509 RepID=A0ABQ5MN97_9FLAO|nr:hypothetical protein Y10_31910 [Neptunitalea sp. Y10]